MCVYAYCRNLEKNLLWNVYRCVLEHGDIMFVSASRWRGMLKSIELYSIFSNKYIYVIYSCLMSDINLALVQWDN